MTWDTSYNASHKLVFGGVLCSCVHANSVVPSSMQLPRENTTTLKSIALGNASRLEGVSQREDVLKLPASNAESNLVFRNAEQITDDREDRKLSSVLDPVSTSTGRKAATHFYKKQSRRLAVLMDTFWFMRQHIRRPLLGERVELRTIACESIASLWKRCWDGICSLMKHRITKTGFVTTIGQRILSYGSRFNQPVNEWRISSPTSFGTTVRRYSINFINPPRRLAVGLALLGLQEV